VLKMRHVRQMREDGIYDMMFPYCRGELLACVTNTLVNRESFENVHVRLLREFIPSRQLRMDVYERVQGEGDCLASYVQAISDAALVLRIQENEAQMVERIVEGFSPSQRTRLVFQTPPPSLRHLEQLTALDRNILYADRRRTRQSALRQANRVLTRKIGVILVGRRRQRWLGTQNRTHDWEVQGICRLEHDRLRD
jgi:hypothetical protein